MDKIFGQLISESLNISAKQVEKTLLLIEQGCTIPFISRYRKEVTGGLNEVEIAAICSQADKLTEIEKRKKTILSSIEESGKLNETLKTQIENCWNPAELEDIYLPYKPKRRTRAEIARQQGLEPLAIRIFKQQENTIPSSQLTAYLNEAIRTNEEAIKGACDIIAEQINEDVKARNIVRNIFERSAVITSKVIKGKEVEGDKYQNYFDWSEPLKRCSSHRLLAMRRGEKEGFLRVSIEPDANTCIERLQRIYVRNRFETGGYVSEAIKDAYNRLMKPSIETEFGHLSKEKADREAIGVFAENLRQLLMAPPLGQKRILGIDPGYRTGCKIVCLDNLGSLLHNETIFPHPPQSDKKGAARKLTQLVEMYKIEAIAIGNGTASRETEQFVTGLRYDRPLQVFVVSENGASVYSASQTAREEFPQYDVTVRGAVSIGRRLMDPLAELVKIEPKAIGVGQYQHDVSQSLLQKSLDQTVESCVNLVGVNVNTASKYLLTYISGLGPQLAQNIIDYREKYGAFKNRRELLHVPRMGAKAFEQCAGFLRIPDSDNPLDNSAVHPDCYPVVEQMARDLGVSIETLIQDKALKKSLQLEKYINDNIGMPTLTDIMNELDKPGNDPRKTAKVFSFDPHIKTIDDLTVGMVLPGIVTNITQFGCFVDIGIKENGLVHISQLADRFVSDPSEVVHIHEQVKVKVIDIDIPRKRIQLSLKEVDK